MSSVTLEAAPEAPDFPESCEGNGAIRFERREVVGASVLMGKAVRSSITGDVALRDSAGFPDFVVVDLAQRSVGGLGRPLEGRLFGDKYLFRPVPLMYRTWLYHSLVRSREILPGRHEEHQMIRHVLAQTCIDAPISGGRSSPLPYYAPLALSVCLIGSKLLVLFTLAVVFLLLGISHGCNSPELYRYSRLLSLPVRAAFIVVLLATFDLQGFVSVVGLVITVAIFLADVATGDVSAIRNLRTGCSYELLRYLGGRVCVCYRHGAFGLEEAFGSRGEVPECVSQIPVWEEQHYLIADIGDLIVELRPLGGEDWRRLLEHALATAEPIPCVALDAISVEAQEEHRLREARSRRFSSMVAPPESMLVEDF